MQGGGARRASDHDQGGRGLRRRLVWTKGRRSHGKRAEIVRALPSSSSTRRTRKCEAVSTPSTFYFLLSILYSLLFFLLSAFYFLLSTFYFLLSTSRAPLGGVEVLGAFISVK